MESLKYTNHTPNTCSEDLSMTQMEYLGSLDAIMNAISSSMKMASHEEATMWYDQFVLRCRLEDNDWMQHHRNNVWPFRAAMHANHERWRQEDMVQQNLDNARTIWLRFVSKNQQDVRERIEQLKTTTKISAIFAGSAVATVAQFVPTSDSSKVLILIVGVLTAIVEGLMTVSMITCTLISQSIFKVGKIDVNESREEKFIFDCLQFSQNFQQGDIPPSPTQTLQSFWETRCYLSWQITYFCFSLGVSLFLLNMTIMWWIMATGEAQMTKLSYIFILGIAMPIWLLIQWSWGAYLDKRKAYVEKSYPVKGHGGLPYDWHLTRRTDDNMNI